MRTSKEFFEMYNKAKWELTGTYNEREEAKNKMFAEWYNEMSVGDHAHVKHYSDISPCTVVKRTKTTITIRYDKTELDPNWKPEFVVGGFCAHCTNNDEQPWNIEEDPNGDTDVFRWHKNDNCFMNASGEKLYPEWMKKYDYNF